MAAACTQHIKHLDQKVFLGYYIKLGKITGHTHLMHTNYVSRINQGSSYFLHAQTHSNVANCSDFTSQTAPVSTSAGLD